MIRIADDAFGESFDGYSSNEAILVSGIFASSAGIAALTQAGPRFLLVDETGVEHTATDTFAADLYTPNAVSDPSLMPEGIRLTVDCKGQIEPPMRETFLKILTEELNAQGIDDAHIRALPNA